MSILLNSTCLATYSLAPYSSSPLDSRDSRGSGRCKVDQEEMVNLVTTLYLLASDLV